MRLIGTAASGIQAQQAALDTVANNIANVNTVGFKASEITFDEALTNAVRAEGTTLLDSPVGDALNIGVGTLPSSVRTDFQAGDFTPTDSPLDLAIEGSGFFQVRRPDGQIAYTKAGNFKVDVNGDLVDSFGNYLEPVINTQGATDISVSPEGIVSGKIGGEEQELGQITLVRFANPEGLSRQENNLYLATANSGAPAVGAPGVGSPVGLIRPYTLEQSNVDLAQAMTDLIRIQRAYQMNARVVSDGDQMWGQANQLRRG